jgi:hypothetical protein
MRKDLNTQYKNTIRTRLVAVSNSEIATSKIAALGRSIRQPTRYAEESSTAPPRGVPFLSIVPSHDRAVIAQRVDSCEALCSSSNCLRADSRCLRSSIAAKAMEDFSRVLFWKYKAALEPLRRVEARSESNPFLATFGDRACLPLHADVDSFVFFLTGILGGFWSRLCCGLAIDAYRRCGSCFCHS